MHASMVPWARSRDASAMAAGNDAAAAGKGHWPPAGEKQGGLHGFAFAWRYDIVHRVEEGKTIICQAST